MIKYRKFAILLLVWAGMVACQQDELRELPQSEEQPEVRPEALIRKGVLQVKFSSEIVSQPQMLTRASGIAITGNKSIDSVLMTLGDVRMERVFPEAGKFEERHKAAGLDRWYRLVFDENIDPLALQQIYACLEGVEKAEPQYEMRLSDEGYYVKDYVRDLMDNPVTRAATSGMPFNDPKLSMQWHYDQGDLFMAEGAGIGLFRAWRVAVGKPEVVVAVVDLGVDYTHEDLAANMWVNEAELNGQPGVDDDGNGKIDDIYGYDFVDDKGDYVIGDHGTHIAGTIAAVNNNGIGVCGVAGGSGAGDGVRIMSCCVGHGITSFSNPEDAIVYAADNGASIIQCSWVVAHSDVLRDAVDYFVTHAGNGLMEGGLAVFAAGNDNIIRPQYPAAYPNTVAVAAVNQNNRRARYSNYGEWIDISAPGGAGSGGETYDILSTLPGNQYGYFHGTSMAAPHVSGVAALIISTYGGPGFTADKLKEILYNSKGPISKDEPNPQMMGNGVLRADNALWVDDEVAPERVTDLKTERKDGKKMLTWHIASDKNDGQPLEYIVYYRQSSPANGIGSLQYIVPIRGRKAGEVVYCPWPEFPENGTWVVAVAGRDPWENESQLSNEVTIEWQNDRKAPAVVTEVKFVQQGEQLYLTWTNPIDQQDGTAEFFRLVVTRKLGTTAPAETETQREIVWDTLIAATGKAGEKTQVLIDIPGVDETYAFRLASIDCWNNASILSPEFFYSPIAAGELKVFPNPVQKELHLKWGHEFSGQKAVHIYDLAGRLVWQQEIGNKTGAGQVVLDLSSLAPGPYVLKFSSDKGTEVRNIIRIK